MVQWMLNFGRESVCCLWGQSMTLGSMWLVQLMLNFGCECVCVCVCCLWGQSLTREHVAATMPSAEPDVGRDKHFVRGGGEVVMGMCVGLRGGMRGG